MSAAAVSTSSSIDELYEELLKLSNSLDDEQEWHVCETQLRKS